MGYLMNKETAVPVFMYHSVGIPLRDFKWRHLTCPFKIFENQIKWLQRHGFITISLNDLYEYIFYGKKIPQRSVILTFDDGYADNWVFAYPIMKKYGMKGTVFVNPEFIDKRDIIRKTIEEVTSPSELRREDFLGFLSWNEIRAAEKTGVFEIESHAMSHSWYPTSEKIIDFRHPGDSYIWMTWNQHPDRKPYLQLDDPELVNYGEPVYEYGKSLNSRRFIPNERISEELINYVNEKGNKEFFSRKRWKEKLFTKAEELRKRFDPGEYEPQSEYLDRIRWELSESKKILENKLGRKIEFLCWPGGSSTEEGLSIAKAAGYKMTTTGRDLSRSTRRSLKNLPSQKSERIARISPVLYWDGEISRSSRMVYDSGLTLMLKIMQYKKMGGAQYYGRIIRKLLKEITKLLH